MITTRAFQRSARDRHRLALPARQRVDRTIGVLDRDIETREVTPGLVSHARLVEHGNADARPRQLRADEDVLPDRLPRRERQVLVDRCNTGSQRAPRGAEVRRAPFDLDHARVRLVRTRDHADEARFARAVVAADRQDLALRDVEVDAAQRLDGAVPLAYAGEANERRRAAPGREFRDLRGRQARRFGDRRSPTWRDTCPRSTHRPGRRRPTCRAR
jgi:hypothetical protein